MIITIADRENLSTIDKVFGMQKKDNIINPILISDFDFRYFINSYNDTKRLDVMLDDDNVLQGIMFYHKRKITSIEDMANYLSYKLHFKDDLIVNNSAFDCVDIKKDFIYVEKVETFKKNQGYGTTLINGLKKDNENQTIFLESLTTSQGFYEKQDFFPLNLKSRDDVIYSWVKNYTKQAQSDSKYQITLKL